MFRPFCRPTLTGLFVIGVLSWTLGAQADSGSKPTPDPPAAPLLKSEGGELIRNHTTIWLRVADLEKAAQNLITLAKKFGGKLASRAHRQITLQVPKNNTEPFKATVMSLGDVLRQEGRGEELSEQLLRTEATLKSKRAAKQRLLRLGRGRNTSEGLAVENELAALDAEITDLTFRAKRLRRARDFSEVLVQLSSSRPRPEQLPELTLPFPWVNRLGLTELMNLNRRPSRPRRGYDSNADIAMNLEEHVLTARPQGLEASYATGVGLHIRGTDADPIGLAAGLDLSLAGHRGLVYDLSGQLGLGTSFGELLTLGLIGGLGLDGWSGNDRLIPSGVAKAELFSLIDVSEELRVTLHLQPRWTSAEERRDGTRAALPVDEFVLGAGLLLPLVVGNSRLNQGGLRLGMSYGEALKSRRYLFSLGYGVGLPDRW